MAVEIALYASLYTGHLNICCMLKFGQISHFCVTLWEKTRLGQLSCRPYVCLDFLCDCFIVEISQKPICHLPSKFRLN